MPALLSTAQLKPLRLEPMYYCGIADGGVELCR